MNRQLTSVFAALEAVLVVAIGVGLPVVIMTLLWAFQYGLQIDWSVFWRAGSDIWLVGHGVDLTLRLPSAAAKATGIAGAGAAFTVTIAALGFAVLTALLGIRAGRRIAENNHRMLGVATAVATFAVLSLLITLSASHPLATPTAWQGIVFPTVVFGVPLLITAEVMRRRRDEPADPVTDHVLDAVDRLPLSVQNVAAAGMRLGGAIFAIVASVSALLVALLLLSHYAEIISLYEGAHAGIIGGLALTIGQIGLIPNAIGWAASWLVGPGFAVGTGSSVSPLGTVTGPMPAVPFLGALPTADLTFGFVGLLVPVVGSFVAATLLRGRIEETLGYDDDLRGRIVTGVSAGLVAGVLLGVFAGLSGGAAGPGRLAEVGPNALLVGLFGALEVAVPCVVALIVPRPDTTGLRDRLPSRSGRSQSESTSASAGVRGRPPARVGPVSVSHSAPSHSAPSHSAPLPGAPSPDDTDTERLDGFTR